MEHTNSTFVNRMIAAVVFGLAAAIAGGIFLLVINSLRMSGILGVSIAASIGVLFGSTRGYRILEPDRITTRSQAGFEGIFVGLLSYLTAASLIVFVMLGISNSAVVLTIGFFVPVLFLLPYAAIVFTPIGYFTGALLFIYRERRRASGEALEDLEEIQDTPTPTRDSFECHWQRKFAWFFGLSYGILIGFSLPVGTQMTLIQLFLFYILGRQLDILTVKFRSTRLLFAAGVINSIPFAIISNHRVLALNSLVFVFIAVMLFCTTKEGELPRTPGSFLFKKLCWLVDVLVCFLNPATFKHFFAPGILGYKIKVDSTVALMFSVLIGLIFHLLLIEVNHSYELFINVIYDGIVETARLIYELGILTIFAISAGTGYLLFCMLYGLTVDNPSVDRPDFIAFRLIKIILLPTVVLLIIFSLFQSELLFRDLQALPYKDLALYVQKGFWELLYAALIGGIMWYGANFSFSTTQDKKKKDLVLLVLFTCCLLALSIFSQHKLITQQILFGFRDQRVLASSGVLLISISFFAFILHLFKFVSIEGVFTVQYWSLIAISLLLSFGNLDRFISTTNPIRFQYHEQEYLDYSYLLTNSFDNHSHWLSIMEKAKETGIPVPIDYYWGSYSSLCSGSVFVDGVPRTVLRDIKKDLYARYGSKENIKKNPREIFKFQYNSYQSYRLMKQNAAEFDSFMSFAERECMRHKEALIGGKRR